MVHISYLSAWVTFSRTTIDLGALPANTYILRAHVHVTEAFNSDGSDTLLMGSDADTNAVITTVDVSTTGIKSVTLGVNAGFNSVAQPLKIFYTAGGSAPTTGAALVILETVKTAPSPV